MGMKKHSNEMKIYAPAGFISRLVRGARKPGCGVLFGRVSRGGGEIAHVTLAAFVPVKPAKRAKFVFEREELERVKCSVPGLDVVGWFTNHPEGGSYSLAEHNTHETFFANRGDVFLVVHGNGSSPLCYYTDSTGLVRYRRPVVPAPAGIRRKAVVDGIFNYSDVKLAESGVVGRKIQYDPSAPRTWHQECEHQKTLAKKIREYTCRTPREIETEKNYERRLASERAEKKELMKTLAGMDEKVVQLGAQMNRVFWNHRTEEIHKTDVNAAIEEKKRDMTSSAKLEKELVSARREVEETRMDRNEAWEKASELADKLKEKTLENRKLNQEILELKNGIEKTESPRSTSSRTAATGIKSERNIIFLEQFRKKKRISWKKLPKPAKFAAMIAVFAGGLYMLSVIFPPSENRGVNVAQSDDFREPVRAREDAPEPEALRPAIETPPVVQAFGDGTRNADSDVPVDDPNRSVEGNSSPGIRIPSLMTTQPVEEENANPPAVRRENPEPAVILYKVKQGDSLWKVCARELGNGSLYRKVGRDNGLSEPYNIRPGMTLRLKK